MAMKWIATATMAVCLLAGGAAQAETGNISDVEISFMGIKFGANYKEVDGILRRHGLEFDQRVDNSYIYNGIIGEDTVSVGCVFIDGGIERIIILFNGKDDLQNEFERKSNILSEKYGHPKTREREYSPPYKEGDGLFKIGLISGKIFFFDFYKDKFGNSVFLLMTKEPLIHMSYNSKKYAEYAEEYKKRAYEIF
mgnify:CR=1 FL=1